MAFGLHVFNMMCQSWMSYTKYGTVGKATHDNMTDAHCTPFAKGCKHTLTICNTYCFSTVAIVVAQC
jgi:hypothetical protein